MQWQLLIAVLVFMIVVLLPAAVAWYLGLGLLYGAETDARQSIGGPSGARPRPLTFLDRVAWIALFVMLAYALYGLGLVALLGDSLSLTLALMVATLLVVLGKVSFSRLTGQVAALRPKLGLATMAGPSLIPPLLVWLLMGGADWKMVFLLSLVGPVVLLPPLQARFSSSRGYQHATRTVPWKVEAAREDGPGQPRRLRVPVDKSAGSGSRR